MSLIAEGFDIETLVACGHQGRPKRSGDPAHTQTTYGRTRNAFNHAKSTPMAKNILMVLTSNQQLGDTGEQVRKL